MVEARTLAEELSGPATPSMRRGHLASPATAVGLAALIGAIGVIDVVLVSHTHQLGASTAINAGFAVVTILVGLVVAMRQPQNPIGWCLLAMPLCGVVMNGASTYSVLDYRMRHGSLPLGAVAVLLQPMWAPAIVLFVFALLLFPDGASPRGVSRWVMWTVTLVGGVWTAGALGIAVTTIVQHKVHVDGGGNLLAVDHATGVWAWWGAFQNAVFPVFIASLGLWGIQQVPNYRRSTGERRVQLKWLYGGSVVSIVCAVLSYSDGGVSKANGWFLVAEVLLFLGLSALPISVGIGILKYRLYEIDRLISRTLAYAVVSGLVVGLYVGVVTLVTKVIGFSSPVAVAASTLAAVALVNPLRRRVQRVVDRRFNRARYDAESTVAAFTVRLRDAVDLETVQSELLKVVHRAVEPVHASVWMKGRERRNATAASPPPTLLPD